VEWDFLQLVLKHLKEHCITAQVQEWPENRLQSYNKIMVKRIKNHNIIDLVLCQECASQSRETLWSIDWEEHSHCSPNVSIIQDDPCVKCEKETTVCYKWLPWKWPKLVSILSNIRSYKHKDWTLFDDCLCQKLPTLCDVWSGILKHSVLLLYYYVRLTAFFPGQPG